MEKIIGTEHSEIANVLDTADIELDVMEKLTINSPSVIEASAIKMELADLEAEIEIARCDSIVEGMYRRNGKIYRVQRWATSGDRYVMRFDAEAQDFVYTPGMMHILSTADRLTDDEIAIFFTL